jgi:hypothetical protein
MGIGPDDIDALAKRPIPLFTTVLLVSLLSPPSGSGDKNNGSRYGNPAFDCLLDQSRGNCTSAMAPGSSPASTSVGESKLPDVWSIAYTETP